MGTGAGGRLAWYGRRLRTMDAAEVGWRVRRLAHETLAPVTGRRAQRALPDDRETWDRWLSAFRLAADRPVLLDRDAAHVLAATHADEVADLVAAAERLLAGRVHYFGYPEVTLGTPRDWHRDPLSGYDWPRVPARRLDHRSAPADPKWIWELNRLQHLPQLAQAWLFTGREEFAEAAFEQLDSWLEQNPVGQGIAWRGAFEAGVRSISVLVALQGLRDSPLLTVERFRAVVETMAASARACWHERSLHSSANNHLIGELAGLATIGLLLPELPGASRWVDRALRLLAHESRLQLLPDGAGAEQAVGYQVFTAELLLVVLLLGGPGGRPELGTLAAGIARSHRYLAGVVGAGDPAPRYGDDDEGFALRLGPEPVRTVRDHLAIVEAFGGGDAPSTGPAGGGLTAAWVAAATRDRGTASLVLEEPLPASFLAPDGGLAVLRARDERLTVDVGPLGYLSLAAHGHADALALTWSLGGAEVIGDPGTGSYYGHPAWRVAHRGTAVHATVAVDDLDQSVIAGPFLWSHHARVQLLEVDLERGVVDAEHDGYTRLDQPVVHRRRVVADPGTPGFLVVDVLQGRGRHRARVSWPLAPDLTAEPSPTGHVVRRDGVVVAHVTSAATAGLDHRDVVGDENTHQGWWSSRLEQRSASHLPFSTAEAVLDAGPLVVASLVRPAAPTATDRVVDLSVRLVPSGAVVTWVEGGRECETDVPIAVMRSATSR